MKKQGYTLVELLVVVAIIAILVAMVVPVLLQAKEAARMRCCAENMRQLGIAINHYMDDFNGYSIPQAPRNNICSDMPRSYKNPWIFCVEPLLKNYIPKTIESVVTELPIFSAEGDLDKRKLAPFTTPKRLWICAGDMKIGVTTASASPTLNPENLPFWYFCGSSYMYPGAGAYLEGDWDNFDPNNVKPRKPGMWRNQKRDMLLADYWMDFHAGKRVPHEFGKGSLTPPAVAELARMKNINILFLDMHMEAVTINERIQIQDYTAINDNPYAGNK